MKKTIIALSMLALATVAGCRKKDVDPQTSSEHATHLLNQAFAECGKPSGFTSFSYVAKIDKNDPNNFGVYNKYYLLSSKKSKLRSLSINGSTQAIKDTAAKYHKKYEELLQNLSPQDSAQFIANICSLYYEFNSHGTYKKTQLVYVDKDLNYIMCGSDVRRFYTLVPGLGEDISIYYF